MTVTERLEAVFRQALGLPEGTDPKPLTYQDCAAWDSVAHMRLVAALETAFDVLLTTEQILDFSSFAQGLALLEQHGVRD